MISDAVKCDVARDFAHGCFVVGVTAFSSRALSPSAPCLHLVLSVLPGVEDVVNIEKREVKIEKRGVKIEKKAKITLFYDANLSAWLSVSPSPPSSSSLLSTSTLPPP